MGISASQARLITNNAKENKSFNDFYDVFDFIRKNAEIGYSVVLIDSRFLAENLKEHEDELVYELENLGYKVRMVGFAEGVCIGEAKGHYTIYHIKW